MENLGHSASISALIDRNIERYAVTHKTTLVSRVIRWGPLDVNAEVAERVHQPPEPHEVFRLEQLPYLAALCALARHGRVRLFTSFELRMERLRQKGTCPGYLGLDLLRDVPLYSVRSPVERSLVIAPTRNRRIGISKDEQIQFFMSIQHPRFHRLRRVIGDAHIADTFHLWTAEESGLEAFVTMDKAFWNVATGEKRKIASPTSVVTPQELCQRFNAPPIPIENVAAETRPFS